MVINKALFHYQQAAIGGHEISRHRLGFIESQRGNLDRTMKHWIISAGSGLSCSLDNAKLAFSSGNATKAQYQEALYAHQKHLNEVYSDSRKTYNTLLGRDARNAP